MIWSFLRSISRARVVFVLALFLVLWALSTAGSGNAEDTALVLAAAVGGASAFAIGIAKSQFGLTVDGKRVLFAAYILAAVVALVALWLTGQLDVQDPAALAKTIGIAAATQQFVFAALKDGRLGQYLK